MLDGGEECIKLQPRPVVYGAVQLYPCDALRELLLVVNWWNWKREALDLAHVARVPKVRNWQFAD